jgi:hypothetical protein
MHIHDRTDVVRRHDLVGRVTNWRMDRSIRILWRAAPILENEADAPPND